MGSTASVVTPKPPPTPSEHEAQARAEAVERRRNKQGAKIHELQRLRRAAEQAEQQLAQARLARARPLVRTHARAYTQARFAESQRLSLAPAAARSCHSQVEHEERVCIDM